MLVIALLVSIVIGWPGFFFIGANNSKLKLKQTLDNQIADAIKSTDVKLQSALNSVKARI